MQFDPVTICVTLLITLVKKYSFSTSAICPSLAWLQSLQHSAKSSKGFALESLVGCLLPI